jgi:hypothetical protein
MQLPTITLPSTAGLKRARRKPISGIADMICASMLHAVSFPEDNGRGTETGFFMSEPKSRVHHYVPRWYQKRFLPVGQETLFYLNLKPETVTKGRIRYTRKGLWRWPPSRCFYVDDLYSMRFGKGITDILEQLLLATWFGPLWRFNLAHPLGR